MCSFRPEFIEALALLEEACHRLEERNLPRPVLVGGGAVEFYTFGGFLSGDLDLVLGDQDALFEELEALGFKKPTSGQLQRVLIQIIFVKDTVRKQAKSLISCFWRKPFEI